MRQILVLFLAFLLAACGDTAVTTSTPRTGGPAAGIETATVAPAVPAETVAALRTEVVMPPTGTAAPAATDTAAPAGSPGPPAAGAPCAPPTASGYSACAVISDPVPSPAASVTTTGFLVQDGLPIPGAIMQVTYRYDATSGNCEAITEAKGTAACAISIQGASGGAEVSVEVVFRGMGGEQLATAETSFTPSLDT